MLYLPPLLRLGLASLLGATEGLRGRTSRIVAKQGHRMLQRLPESTTELQSFELVNSATNEKVATIRDGDVFYLDALNLTKPTFNVNATYTGRGGVGSVRFVSNVAKYDNVIENSPFFALCGNVQDNFRECPTLGAGKISVTATPYPRSRARGRAGPSLTVSFEIAYTNKTSYQLENLTYSYDALEPYIDSATMNLHHSKHHGAAVTNLIKATENVTHKLPLVALMENALNATAIRNNGGSHYNHALFWDHLAPYSRANQTRPSAQLDALLNESFGGLQAMQAQFNAAAAPGTLFGSGWVWLCVNANVEPVRLEIVGTPNQDNPLMKGVVKSIKSNEVLLPILGLDVWEHAYYLKHQNRRPDYVSSWWNVVDWDKVSNNTAYVIANQVGVDVKG